MTEYYDALETRSADERAADLSKKLPALVAKALASAPAMAAHLGGISAGDVTSASV